MSVFRVGWAFLRKQFAEKVLVSGSTKRQEVGPAIVRDETVPFRVCALMYRKLNLDLCVCMYYVRS